MRLRNETFGLSGVQALGFGGFFGSLQGLSGLVGSRVGLDLQVKGP